MNDLRATCKPEGDVSVCAKIMQEHQVGFRSSMIRAIVSEL
jgi:hypothetical protein